MPDDLPDLGTPLPDLAHESLRQATVAAIDELRDEVRRVNAMLQLLEATADFAQSTLATSISAHARLGEIGRRLTTLEAAGQQMQAAVAGLDARVTALEGHHPTPEPTP